MENGGVVMVWGFFMFCFNVLSNIFLSGYIYMYVCKYSVYRDLCLYIYVYIFVRSYSFVGVWVVKSGYMV